MSEPVENNRPNLIQAITSPLGFFALSLFVVEGFLTIALTLSNLSPHDKFIGMLVGAGLFVIVVAGVFLLVLIRPTNLTFSEYSHLHSKWLEKQKFWGTSDMPETKSRIEENTTAVAPPATVVAENQPTT